MSISSVRYETATTIAVNLGSGGATMRVIAEELLNFKYGVSYPFYAQLTRISDSAVEVVLCTADDSVDAVSITRAQDGTTALAFVVGDVSVRQCFLNVTAVTNVTATSPLASSGGTTPDISLTVSVGVGSIGGVLPSTGALASLTTNYAYPQGINTALAGSSTQDVRFTIPKAGFLKNLQIARSFVTGSSRNDTLTVEINGSLSTLAVALVGVAATGADNTHSVAVSAGDVVSLRIQAGAGLATTCGYSWGMEYSAT